MNNSKLKRSIKTLFVSVYLLAAAQLQRIPPTSRTQVSLNKHIGKGMSKLQTPSLDKSCHWVPSIHKKNLSQFGGRLGGPHGLRSYKILVIKVKISKILILMKLKIYYAIGTC